MNRLGNRDTALLTREVTVITVLGFLLAAAFLAGFVQWAREAVDRQSEERQVNLATHGLVELIRQLPVEQGSITLWDDAVLRTAADDQAWMEENVGAWVSAYFGHDEVYVLDPTDAPVHAAVDGATAVLSAWDRRAAAIAPLLRQLRAEMAEATRGFDNVADPLVDTVAAGFVLFGDVPAGVSLRPIIPSTDAATLPPGQEYVHVSARRLDGKTLDRLASAFQLPPMQVLLPGEELGDLAAVPIRNAAGSTIAFIAWEPARPGTAMVVAVAPGLAAATLVAIGLLSWLLLRLRRSAARVHASESRAQFLAFHDTLTGLPNRALFEERLGRALAAARSSGSALALHYIDIDRFKNINDTRGHPAGDELIRLVGKRLGTIMRAQDTVARLGGDEFALIQSEIDGREDAEQVARRIVEALAKPYSLLGEIVHASASLGVVVPARLDITGEDLQRRADIALYEAKAQGRGRHVVFAEDMDEMVRQRRTIEEDLRHALETGTQLKLVYQPIFSGTPGNDILGAEALVRWDHPQRGTLSPALFIGVAEERGLIGHLGEFVLREAARFALEIDLPWVAVNVSPVELRDEDFPERVLGILQEIGLQPNRLELEITEAVLLENARMVQTTLARLRSAGVRIALDDFGTGYSSMAYLQRYSVDKLKIDQSFVAELGGSADAGSIVSAMIGLARSLKLQVTAEGVETAEQRDELAALGCNELQGYLLSRPVASEELRALLQAGSDLSQPVHVPG